MFWDASCPCGATGKREDGVAEMGSQWGPLPERLDEAEVQLASELRLIKDTSGLSLQALGEATHYSRTSWERWLNGKRLPTRAAIDALIAALGIDGASLLALWKQAVTSPHAPTVPPAVLGPDTTAPDGAPDAATGDRRAAQLPPDIGDFVGRAEQIAELADALRPQPERGGATPVVVLSGAGGLGKSALAVKVAHQAGSLFPDGLLYVDLRGADTLPRDPCEVLGGWLRALGVEPGQIPAEVTERTACLRGLAYGRRLLLVLDNAFDAAQVRPLLPAAGTCGVLITSRTRLAGLPGAHRLDLDLLADGEAAELLVHEIGAGRMGAEPEAATLILAACGGLPLAVRIAGARLAARPSWTLAYFAERLSRQRQVLNELQVEDLAVRTMLQVSYCQLSAEQARAFRLVGLIDCGAVGTQAAAALLGCEEHIADHLLECLVDARLLDTPAPGRYLLHDLVRNYAAERAADEESGVQLEDGSSRLIGWYLHTVLLATRRLPVTQPPAPPRSLCREDPVMRFAGRTDALTWFDAERDGLLSALHLADTHGPAPGTWWLAHLVASHHDLRGWCDDMTEASTIGLRNARAAGDEEAEGHMLWTQGWFSSKRGDQGGGMEQMSSALEIFARMGDVSQRACALGGLSFISDRAGRPDQAMEYARQALRLRRQLGSPRDLATALANLARACVDAGLCGEGLELCEELLPMVRNSPADLQILATALEISGHALRKLGRAAAAVPALTEAADIYLQIGAGPDQALLLEGLGHALLAAGHPEAARQVWSRAADLFDHHQMNRAVAVRERLRGISPQ
jgi:transcriptional regulator with XRE-family HTH domain